jgi:hypothetical protein
VEQRSLNDLVGDRVDALLRFIVRHGDAQYDATQLLATADVLAAFEVAGVEVLLLKGAGLGALLYGAPERRTYSDVDLLVAPDQLTTAERVVSGLGYKNATAIQGAEDMGGNVHAHTWVPKDAQWFVKPMVDLHWTLAGARATPAVVWGALWKARTKIELASRHAAVLDCPGQAMQLAMHAAQHGPKFDKHLGELSLALGRWREDVWESAAALAREIGALEAFAAGLRLVPDGALLASELALPSTGDVDWTIQHANSQPRGTFHVRALMTADGLSERARVVRHSLFPSRAWISYEHSWARGGRLRLAAAYCVHLLCVPLWAARAFKFARRARREGRRSG